MAVDGKHPSTWVEADLQELCTERRRETQRLEFKRELRLDTDGQRKEAERDAIAMANGGGGVILYGVEEADLPDGGAAASTLCALVDGSLYQRLNSLLDDRGDPRMSFDLHAVDARGGGIYLVLDISGRRRPHRANDGRYYGRRGTAARPMSESEVAEAYRDRFVRESTAMQTVTRQPQPDDGLPQGVRERVHRGLKPHELVMWREETGETYPPGWMSVVVVPDPPQRGIVEPIRDRDRFPTISIPDQWDDDQPPMLYFHLLATLNGLRAQLPPTDEMAPAYFVAMERDGLMEYGTTLEPALRDEDPEKNRIIFTKSHPFQAHDYLQAFAVALGELEYEGPVAAQVAFDDLLGTSLGISRWEMTATTHPIDVDRIESDVWRGERTELLDAAGFIVKQVMDDVYLAAGIDHGYTHLTPQGRLDSGRGPAF